MIDKRERDLIYREVLKELEAGQPAGFGDTYTRPRFLAGAEREARRLGVSVDALLEQQMARLRASDYPGPECLDPESIQQLLIEGPTSVQKRHLDRCSPCATLVTLSQDCPDPPVISLAFLEEIQMLEGRNDRRAALRKMLDQYCADAHDDRIAEKLIRRADRENWPTWAVECLPSLYVRSEDQPGRALVWHYLADCVPDGAQVAKHEALCGGIVLDVALGSSNQTWTDAFGPVFEKSRLGNPFPSVESMVGVVLDTISTVGTSAASLELPVHLHQARDRVFRSLFQSVVEIAPAMRGNLTREIAGSTDTDHEWVKTALKGVAA
jgi:hypothetical protein